MRLLAAAALLLFTARVTADVAEAVCAQTCSAANTGDSGYQAGHQYVYVYRGQANTNTAGEHHQHQSQHQSPMSVVARVVVTVGASPCDLRMQIPSLEMEGDSAWFKEAVQTHDLYFSYQGGRIEDVCPHEEEVAAATNFKRAVLSLLHASLKPDSPPPRVIVQESDVSGECETEYQVVSREEGNKVVMNKTKHDCLSSIQLPHLPHSPSPPDHPSVMPYFRSNLECEMESVSGVWQRVECEEEVKVAGPLAPSHGPVTLMLASSLALETTRPDPDPQAFHQERRTKRESLRMRLDKAGRQGQPQEASVTLAQVADTLEVLAREEGQKNVEWPRVFSHLVELLGLLQHQQDLQDVWDTYSGRDDYRSVVLDGMLACDSGPCTELVTRLATQKPSPLSSSTLASWLAGVHLQSHSDPAAVPHIMRVVEERAEVGEAAVRAASSLVFRVCHEDPNTCHHNAKAFLKYVRAEVGEGCGWGQSQARQHRVKVALQALANAGVTPKDHLPERCYRNKLLATEVRVAALQTTRRTGCPHSEAPWTVLEDGSDGVEVRVAAYLALQPCASTSPLFFPRLQKLLEKEQANQVGSFIWTHVHNLAEHPSNSREGREVARLAAQLTLNNNFNSNPFQASRNYRLAHFSDVLGAGGMVDGNVVFSPESYLPRTAGLNLTLQLLGKAVNIFEIGGDFKGLEDYMERFFEKGKYFENEDIQKLLQNLRPKREASADKLEEYQALYNKAKTEKEALEGGEADPTVSMYLRVFGNEMMRSDNVLKSDPLTVIQETLQQLSSPRAFQVMNQEFVMATHLGFPLRLKYNVTGSLSLDKEGRLQALKPGQLLLEGKLSPTVAVTADETLLLDGFGIYSGLQRTTTHHAHSHLGGKINIHNGRLVDAQLDLPKTEVLKIHSSVKIKLYSNADQGWRELATRTPSAESEGCSSRGLSDITGLQVCHVERSTKQNTDAADTESYERKIVISKTDNFDKFVLTLQKSDTNFEAVIDTPGSSVDRRVSVVLTGHSDGVEGTLVVPGRQVEGRYQWSPALKRLAVKYRQDSVTHGEVDVSVAAVREGTATLHTPSLKVSVPGMLEVRANASLRLGPKSLGWNATLMSSLQEHAAASQGHWEVKGQRHQASARVSSGQHFGSVSGSVQCEAAETAVEAKAEYGSTSAPPNTLALSAHFTQTLQNKDRSLQGHINIQSSQAAASLALGVRHGPGHTAVNASLSLPSAMINSTLVAKCIGEDEKRDFEMAFSVSSPQLALDYLGRALYKVSEGDFQAEAEVRLGSLGHAKASVSHLLHLHPLHALAGLHLHLNDHLLQAGYTIDLSQPDHAQVMVSFAVGGVTAGFHTEADYRPRQPFRGVVKVLVGSDGQQVGASLHTASDAAWHSFNGSMELTWFERVYVVRHEALWNAAHKGITFTNDQSSLQLMYQSLPSPRAFLLVKSGTSKTLQVVAEKTAGARSQTYQAYVMQGEDRPLHLSATWNKNQSFSGSLKFLRSEIQTSGSVRQPHPDRWEGSAEVTVVLPSRAPFTTNLTLAHAYDGTTRELNVSSVSNGLRYEGKFKLKQHDGWFSNDSFSLAVQLTTPLAGLHSAALLLETHADPAHSSLVQLEWEDVKIRGEIQVGDPSHLFDLKVQYEAGPDTCDAQIHLFHKYVHDEYVTGATVRPPGERDPWEAQVVTRLADTHNNNNKSLEATFTSPLFATPFQFTANYSHSESHLDLRLQGGTERQASLAVFGRNDRRGNTEIYEGTLDLQSPWTSPLFVNASHHLGKHGLNVTLDLRTMWDPVNNVKADLGVAFVNTSDFEAHFHLHHEHLEVMMDLGHRLAQDGISSQLEFSANAVRVNSKIICTWDDNFVPQSATGQLSILNVFSEPQDFSFSLIKGISDFHTQLLASHGDRLLRVDHQLQVVHALDWVSVLSVVLPNREDIVENKITLKVAPDLSSVKGEFSITSPWTEDIRSHFSSQRVSSLRETEFTALHGGSSLAELTLKTPEPFSWDQSNIALNVSLAHFSAVGVHWKHQFGKENIITAQIFVDGEFYLKGEHKLMLSRSQLTQNFEQFYFAFMVSIPSRDFDFETKLLLNADLSGELEIGSGDYLLYVTSLHKAGELLSVVSQGPSEEWRATLRHDPGPSALPNLLLNVTKDGTDIFSFGSKFTQLYPKLDGSLRVSLRLGNEDVVKNGRLHIAADMSRIQYYAFKGDIRLDSNFEGFEKYWAELDTDVNMKGVSLDGKLSGALHIGDWQYRTNLQGSLELPYRNFGLKYKNEYVLLHHQQVLDKKEINLSYHGSRNLTSGNITIITGHQAPLWGLYLNYDNPGQEVKAYAIPGNEKKYQIVAGVAGNEFSIDSQVVSEGLPAFKVIAGTVGWSFRRRRRLIKIDLSSDFSKMKTVKGIIGIQRRRRLAVTARLAVNEAEFTGNMTYMPLGPRTPARVTLELDNKIVMPFKTAVNLTYAMAPGNLESRLVIDWNDEKNWVIADAKGSLPESYIKLKLPYKEFENVTISLKVLMEQQWGVQANVHLPGLCVNLEGKLDPTLKLVLVSTKVLKDCEDELFDFYFSYEMDSDGSGNVTSQCRLQNYGTIYKLKVIGEKWKLFDAEIQVYSLFSLGLKFTSERKAWTLMIHSYNLVSDWTYFLYQQTIASDQSEVSVEVNERAMVALKTHYSVQQDKFYVNGTLSHSLFYLPFSATLTTSGKMEEKFGDINLGLSTSSPKFSQADLQVAYKFAEKKEISFKVMSTLGNAEGSAVLRETSDTTSITLDMTSGLHAFRDYHIALTHRREGRHHHVSALSTQDDLEFKLEASLLVQAEAYLPSITITTPFKTLETLHVSLEYPNSNSSGNSYMFDVSGVNDGGLYGITLTHDHYSGWDQQNTTVVLTTPSECLGNASLSVAYDIHKHANILLNTSEGDANLVVVWRDFKTHNSINSTFDISHFGLGKYVLHLNIPRTASRNEVVRFEYNQADVNYTIQLTGGRNFNYAKLRLDIHDPRWAVNQTTYSLGYDLYPQKYLLNLEGQYKDLEATAVIKLKKNTIPLLSGTFKVQTNIDKYKVMNGSWNIARRDQAYITEAKLDIDEVPVLSVKAQVNSQPQGASTPWHKVEVDVEFESSFTHTHHLHVEYEVKAWRLTSWYKVGLDHFHLKLIPRLKPKAGTFLLTGNVPIRGLSTFSVDLNYKLKDVYVASLRATLEETTLITSVELEPRKSWSSLKASVTSPFFQPLRISLLWTLKELPWLVEASATFAGREGALRIKTNPYGNSKELEIHLNLPFDYLSKVLVAGKYTNSQGNLRVAAECAVNNHTLSAETKIKYNSKIAKYEFSGLENVYGTEGRIGMVYDNTGNQHRGNASVSWSGSEMFTVSLIVNPTMIQMNMKNNEDSYLNAKLTLSQVDIDFIWNKETYANMSISLTPHADGYDLDLTVDSSESMPVKLRSRYSHREGQEGTAFLSVGEREYNVSVNGDVSKKSSGLTFHLQSSQSPRTPVVFKAEYNLRDFVRGRMTSLTDLASLSFEWGEKIQFLVKGMRNENQLRMKFEMFTPFKCLPKLTCGFDSEFSAVRSNLELMSTVSVEWSQKITFTGVFKLVNGNADIFIGVTSSFPALEMLDASIKYESSSIEATATVNKDKWSLKTQYTLRPFTIGLAVTTPLAGYEVVSLTAFGPVRAGRLAGEAQLTWGKTSAIKLEVEAQRWDLHIKLQTPWKPLQEAALQLSLRTESEALMYTTAVSWDHANATLTAAYSPVQLKVTADYKEDSEEIGFAMLEYTFGQRKYKASLQIRTPFGNFKSLEMEFNIKPKIHDFTVDVIANNSEHTLEMTYSKKQGKLKVHLPMLNNFMWTLEAKKMWLELTSEASVSIGKTSRPTKVSVSYLVSPEDKQASLRVSCESLHKWMDSLSLNVTATYDGTSMEASTAAAWKLHGEGTTGFNADLTLGIIKKHIDVQMMVEGPCLEYPIKLTCKIPFFNFLMKEGLFELVFIREAAYKVTYKTKNGDEVSALHHLAVDIPGWSCNAALVLKEESLTLSVSLPHASTNHSLSLKWPNTSLEHLSATVELQSPYLPHQGLLINASFIVRKKFSFSFNSTASYGQSFIAATGMFQYTKKLRELKCEGKIVSNWLDDYQVEANVRWLRNIKASIQVKIPGQKHSCSLLVDVTGYTLDITCTSPWLPDGNCSVSAKVNRDLSLSKVEAEGQVTGFTKDEALEIKVTGGEGDPGVWSAEVRVKQGDLQLHRLSAKVTVKKTLLKIRFQTESVDPRLRSHLNLHLESKNGTLSLLLQLSNHYVPHASLQINNSKNWRELQKIYFISSTGTFEISSQIGETSGYFKLGIKVFNYDLWGSIHYDLSNVFTSLLIDLRSTYDILQALVFEMYRPTDASSPMLKFFLLSKDEQESKVDIHCFADPVMGRSFLVAVSTPMAGFEEFQLQTPQFNYSSHIFRAFVAYPGGKVGTILTSRHSHRASFDMQFSLYLPFEDYDIISLQLVDNDVIAKGYFGVELRVGKVGVTLTTKNLSFRRLAHLELLIKLNEWTIKANFKSIITFFRFDKIRTKLHVDLPEFLLGTKVVSTQLRYDEEEQFLFLVKNEFSNVVKAHWSWGEAKIFSLTTPRVYPGHLIFHLESGPEVQECQVKASLSSTPGSLYGFHIHHRHLQAGHHVSLLGLAPQTRVSLEATHHITHKLLKESLLLGINEKQVGYKACLSTDPGLLTSSHAAHVSLLLPLHSVHVNTTLTCAFRAMSSSSMLAWGKSDSLMQPLSLNLKYNDYSVFNKGRRHLSAVLSHPDIQAISLVANSTRWPDSSLQGWAELVDGNSPESVVVAGVKVEPARRDGRQSVSLSLSQPLSNLSLLVDAQLRREPTPEAVCSLQYYSLASQAWQRLNLSASLESEGSGRAVTVTVAGPREAWGRTWRGALDSRPEEAALSLEGRCVPPGNAWKLAAVLKRHVPQLLVYSSVAKEGQVYEEARVRLGLHSPVEAGATLDHTTFGQWHRDAALGVTLTSPHVLQAYLHFDPSLDYQDEAAITRLLSPLHKVLHTWQRDVTSAVSGVSEWINTEASTLSQALVSKPALITLYNSELHSLSGFLVEAEEVMGQISGQSLLLWRERIVPRLQEALTLITSMHEWARVSLHHLSNHLSASLHRWTTAWEVRWRLLSHRLASLHYRLRVWWNRTEGRMEAHLHAAMYWVARSINLATAAARDWTTAATEPFQPLLHTLSAVTARYGQELSSALMSECWWPMRQVWRQLHHSLTQAKDTSWGILREFLQPETTLPMLSRASQNVRSRARQVLGSLQDGLQRFRQSLPDAPSFPTDSRAYQNMQTLLQHAQPILSDLMENGMPALVPHMTSATDRVMLYLGERIDAMQRYSGKGAVFTYINAASRNVYDKLSASWHSWKESDRAADTVIVKLFKEIMKKVLNLDDDIFIQSYVFDPAVRGRVEYNQHLPVAWPSFLHTPCWHSLAPQGGVAEAQRILREGVEVTPSGWRPGFLYPPSTATATIIGQHITTFDQHHHTFLGPCSYLLARDFVNGDFSVVGEYRAEAGVVSLASIQLLTPARTFVINVNGSLEASQEHSQVHESLGESSLKVGGVLVTCGRAMQGCAVTVSNKYFGRLAGLLGNYNHEPSDDSRGPDGRPVTGPAQLATAWAVGEQPCYRANQAVETKVESADGASVSECSLLFLQGSSPFSPCFYAVNPRAYFTHCITNNRQTGAGGKPGHDLCGAVTAYVTQCLAQGISLTYPDQCKTGKARSSVSVPVLSGSCEVPEGKPVPSQWSKTFEGETQGSADLAFIVELANCNKGKNLQHLLQLVKVHSRRAGSEDVRYALLTVREGRVGEPSSFMPEEAMASLLNGLDLQGPRDDQGGAAAVIAAARRLKWRPGVSRTVVQLSCRACDAGAVVHQALQENDVTFHLVTKHKVTMAGPDPKKSEAMARKLLGFDSKFGYTVRDIKKFSGTEKLRVALQEPEGSCVMAAQASGGSVFNMNKWLPGKEVLTKKFLRVLSHRVAVSSAAPECQKCQCVGGATEMKLQCRKCSSEFSVPGREAAREGPHPPLHQHPVKKNYTITADIKKNFADQFVNGNAALAVLGNGNRTNFDESVPEESESSEEDEESQEEEEEYGDYEDDSFTQNYYNYEAEY